MDEIAEEYHYESDDRIREQGVADHIEYSRKVSFSVEQRGDRPVGHAQEHDYEYVGQEDGNAVHRGHIVQVQDKARVLIGRALRDPVQAKEYHGKDNASLSSEPYLVEALHRVEYGKFEIWQLFFDVCHGLPFLFALKVVSYLGPEKKPDENNEDNCYQTEMGL